MPRTLAPPTTAPTLGLLLLAAVECAGRYVEPNPGGGVAVKSAQVGWYTKKVATKQEPATLLAGDGTICRVSPDRFRATKSGAMVLCNWW
jgi:hypothetical protein